MLGGLVSQAGAQGQRRLNAFGLSAAVCVLLLALFAIVQVAHVHPLDTDSDADHCPLCIVMHTAAPVAVAAAVVVLVEVGRQTPTLEVIPVVIRRSSRIYIRPPPTDC